MRWYRRLGRVVRQLLLLLLPFVLLDRLSLEDGIGSNEVGGGLRARKVMWLWASLALRPPQQLVKVGMVVRGLVVLVEAVVEVVVRLLMVLLVGVVVGQGVLLLLLLLGQLGERRGPRAMLLLVLVLVLDIWRLQGRVRW